MFETFHAMNEEDARAVLRWRYAEPYDFYNADPDALESEVRKLLDPANSYYGVTDGRGALVAYCCFGPDARVPGGDYGPDALDVGAGLRPDLTGAGLGLSMLRAVLRFGDRRFAPPAFRATVAAWNERALLVCERAGFRAAARFEGEGGGSFTVLLRPAGGAD